MLKSISAFAAVLAASALVVPTVSQAETVNSVSVSYADLNLATGAGEKILERRIANAARAVCEIEDSHELALAQATAACRGDAIASAQPAFDAAVRGARRGEVTVLEAAALTISVQ